MAILALHGFTGRGSDFAPLAKLCGGEWHCPDLPGHGPTPQLDCSPEATIDFVNLQIPSLHCQFSTKKNILLGYSMGARAALLHATKYPELWEKLILISPNPGIQDNTIRVERRQSDASLAKRIEQHGIRAFINFWQETPLIRSQKEMPEEWRTEMLANRLEHEVTGLASSLRQFGQGSVPNLWEQLDQLSMPIKIITGESDKKYTGIAEKIIKSTAGTNQQFEHYTLAEHSHAPHLEAPETCAAMLKCFIETS